MNRAQKRTCFRLLISLAALLVASTLIIYFRSRGIDVYDLSTPTAIRRYVLLGILSTVPLILIVVTDWGWKKVYDERDKQIDNRSSMIGAIGAITFIALAGWYLTVATKMGSIRAVLIILLVYLAYWVWNLILSIATLIQYAGLLKGTRHE